MKHSTLRAALMFAVLTAPPWGSSSWADDAHHPAQAAPAETQATPSPSAPSAQGQTQPGQTPGGMMMNCPMMMPGQTQGMGSGMMQGQQRPPAGNQ